jgi:putative hydrolase of the HAD superfamily
MNSAPIKAVLFDLDDTLWPIAPVIQQAETVMHTWLSTHASHVAQRFSIEQLRARRLELLAANPAYRINLSALRHAALTEAFIMAGEDVSGVDPAMAAFLAARNTVSLFDDVMPTLLRLRGKVALGSISNGVADLQTIGLAHHFQVSVAAHHFGCAKPDASIFHAACKALDVLPAQAVYVGDDPEIDIAGAQRAGLQTVWINRSNQTMPAHIVPHGICTNLHELHDWLALRLTKSEES